MISAKNRSPSPTRLEMAPWHPPTPHARASLLRTLRYDTEANYDTTRYSRVWRLTRRGAVITSTSTYEASAAALDARTVQHYERLGQEIPPGRPTAVQILASFRGRFQRAKTHHYFCTCMHPFLLQCTSQTSRKGEISISGFFAPNKEGRF